MEIGADLVVERVGASVPVAALIDSNEKGDALRFDRAGRAPGLGLASVGGRTSLKGTVVWFVVFSTNVKQGGAILQALSIRT